MCGKSWWHTFEAFDEWTVIYWNQSSQTNENFLYGIAIYNGLNQTIPTSNLQIYYPVWILEKQEKYIKINYKIEHGEVKQIKIK